MQMSPEAQDQIIAEMVKERNTLRRERTLLEEQINRSTMEMHNASAAASLLLEGKADRLKERLKKGYAYQDADTFLAALSRYREIGERLAVLQERLDACC